MKKYDYKVGGKIRHSGITKDLDRREQEHQQRWPGGRIKQVGRSVTKSSARRWERTKTRSVTPRRGSKRQSKRS
jgi:hypothetical protein